MNERELERQAKRRLDNWHVHRNVWQDKVRQSRRDAVGYNRNERSTSTGRDDGRRNSGNRGNSRCDRTASDRSLFDAEWCRGCGLNTPQSGRPSMN